jgi:hypothetical protein
MKLFATAAPMPVSMIASARLIGVIPHFKSKVVATKVYGVPKNGVAFVTIDIARIIIK